MNSKKGVAPKKIDWPPGDRCPYCQGTEGHAPNCFDPTLVGRLLADKCMVPVKGNEICHEYQVRPLSAEAADALEAAAMIRLDLETTIAALRAENGKLNDMLISSAEHNLKERNALRAENERLREIKERVDALGYDPKEIADTALMVVNHELQNEIVRLRAALEKIADPNNLDPCAYDFGEIARAALGNEAENERLKDARENNEWYQIALGNLRAENERLRGDLEMADREAMETGHKLLRLMAALEKKPRPYKLIPDEPQ